VSSDDARLHTGDAGRDPRPSGSPRRHTHAAPLASGTARPRGRRRCCPWRRGLPGCVPGVTLGSGDRHARPALAPHGQGKHTAQVCWRAQAPQRRQPPSGPQQQQGRHWWAAQQGCWQRSRGRSRGRGRSSHLPQLPDPHASRASRAPCLLVPGSTRPHLALRSTLRAAARPAAPCSALLGFCCWCRQRPGSAGLPVSVAAPLPAASAIQTGVTTARSLESRTTRPAVPMMHCVASASRCQLSLRAVPTSAAWHPGMMTPAASRARLDSVPTCSVAPACARMAWCCCCCCWVGQSLQHLMRVAQHQHASRNCVTEYRPTLVAGDGVWVWPLTHGSSVHMQTTG